MSETIVFLYWQKGNEFHPFKKKRKDLSLFRQKTLDEPISIPPKEPPRSVGEVIRYIESLGIHPDSPQFAKIFRSFLC